MEALKRPLEIASFLAMGGLLIAPWFIAGLTSWGWLFTAIVATVIGWELWSVATSKRTISQKFWAYSKRNRAGAWAVLGAVTGGWVLLMWHLAVKMM